MKKFAIPIAVLVAITALGSGSASASNAPVRVTFDKQATAVAGTFAGMTGGDAPGTLSSQLVSIDGVSVPVLRVTFDWFGAQVHEQGQLITGKTLRFQGVIQLMPGTA